MSPSTPPTLLLDLDGTLVDPAVGILQSCRAALDQLGCPVPPDEDLSWMIGPPVRESFRALLGGRADPEEALRLYRISYGAQGLYEAAVYPGIPAALADLRDRGVRPLVCTSKAQVFARRVVDHFGLGWALSEVYGADLDGRYEDKGDLIAHILEVEALDPALVCMVGDRKHDVLGAARHAIPTIGVLWGYGGEVELKAAGASALVAAPAELPAAWAALQPPPRAR